MEVFTSLQILMKNTNYLVDYMVYESFLGNSLLLAFGNSFPGFRKIFTPAKDSSSSLKIADFGMVSESLRLRMIVTMNRESWAVPR